MTSPHPLRVVFYRTAGGREPVRDWLKSLPKDDRRTIGIDLKTVQFLWPIGRPLVGAPGDGLWEVRSRLPNRIARVIFFAQGQRLILVHAFIKKSQKIDQADLEIARRRKKAFEDYEA